jgi:hypothetical protein
VARFELRDGGRHPAGLLQDKSFPPLPETDLKKHRAALILPLATVAGAVTTISFQTASQR